MAPGGEDNSSQQRQQPSTVAGADAPKLRISLGGGAGQGSRPAGKASTPVSAPTRSAAKRSSTVAAVAPAALPAPVPAIPRVLAMLQGGA